MTSERTVDGSAREALDAVQHRPRDAIAIAQRVLARTQNKASAVERAIAERAIGLALRELNDLPGAVRHLRRSVRLAKRGDSEQATALALMSLGFALATSGHNVAALHAVSEALPRLTGVDAARARMQRGVVLHYRGHYDDAMRDYGAAIEIACQEGDLLLEARARNNRGVIHTHHGTARGTDDLDRAASIFHVLGMELAAADARWNIGAAAARRGEVAVALRVFADVEQEHRRLQVPRPGLLLNRLELLLSIPLVDEAIIAAADAVHELDRRDMASDLAEALLAQSRAALLAHDLDLATAAATRARRLFQRQGRSAWALLARGAELQAELRRGNPTGRLLSRMVRTADLLDEAGWPGPALGLRIEAARLAIQLGRPAQARALLKTAGRARRGGTASQRAQGWYATALLHRLDGADRAARTALRNGLHILDTYRASLGATELRAHSGLHGEDLATEGLRMALAGGRPSQVLHWAERWRANVLRMTPVTPPRDLALADVLAELRVVNADADTLALNGRSAAPHRRHQADLEQRIRDLTRQTAGGGNVLQPPTLRLLAAALGAWVLVELVGHAGRIAAVVVRDGRTSLHDVGRLDDALHHLRLQRFALRRLVTRGDSAASRLAARHAAAQLDAQLLAPLRPLLGDRPLVVVPLGQLHALAWSALPSCVGRPITVAPSAASWLHATERPAAAGATVLVAGPRLPDGEIEVAALAAANPDARLFTGAAATTAQVLDAMNGARLVHIAAHGTFRSDNPLLSTIDLIDGPMTAYELERISDPPDCVVLSACESGLSAIRSGDELMGLAAVLLGGGARSLVASVLPVPAQRTTDLALKLHEHLRSGVGPAQALAQAQGHLNGDSDGVASATAAAFICIGAGSAV